MVSLNFLSPPELARSVAERAKRRRLDLGLTREELAERAGINLWTLKRFEETGEISFGRLVALAFALGSTDPLERLFEPRAFTSIEEVLTPPTRQRRRGRRARRPAADGGAPR